MRLSREETHRILRERFGEAIVEERLDVPDPYIVVRREAVPEIAVFARDDARLRMDYLSAVIGVDYPDRGEIEVIYAVESTAHGSSLIFKARLPRDDPRVRTVERVWPAADWHERETFDLVGVVFEGHHNLCRILCAEDWVGHPLRKDYAPPKSYRGIPNTAC